MGKTAAELMAELAEDKDYMAKKRFQNKKTDDLNRVCELDEKELVSELHDIGFPVKSVWDFVNADNYYLDAAPVLVRHLKIKHHPKILAGIARSLAMPALSGDGKLWQTLIDLYKATLPDRNIEKPEERGAQEAIAIALESLATPQRLDSLKKVIADNPDKDGISWLQEKLIKFS